MSSLFGSTSWWNFAKRVAKFYLVFAVFNVLYKVRHMRNYFKRAVETLKYIPGGDFEDRLGRKIAKNALRFHDYWKDHVLQYPNAPLIKGPGPDVEVVCNTPESVEWMLKTEFKNITKPGPEEDYVFYLLGRFIGFDGVFTLRHGTGDLARDNAKWNAQRKITSQIFTKKNFVNTMRDVFCEKSDRLIEMLNEKASKQQFVDLQERFFAFTMDSIQKIFFGLEVNTVSANGADAYGKAFDLAHENMMRHLINNVLIQILAAFLFPWPIGSLHLNYNIQNSLAMMLLQKVDKAYVEFQRNIGVLDNFCKDMIAEIRSDPNINNRKDMLANFLNSKYGAELDDKTLRDILLNLTIAGRDTTACTLTWMFFMLTQNPEVQKKLQEEIDEKIGDRDPELEDLTPENMPYLNGVLYETLRLYPPVPIDVKVAQKDLVFYDGKTVIPEGARLLFIPYSMGKNPSRYPDPMKVDPTRWIPFKQPTLFEFPVFQAGLRYCLGKDMAQFEAKIVAAKLLRRFSFELKEGEAQKITYSFNLTLSLSNSKNKDSTCLWIKPVPRN